MTRILFAALLSIATLVTATAQTSANCPVPPAILKSTQPNIFSEQQEQWLGDAMADMLERDYKPVKDPAQNEYLTQIVKRLLGALPPTTMPFRVVLVDSAEVNGFSLAGGRVYLTRKLVANARNEDEVASVIAHEMGHILSHQFAVETTADLRRLLNVTSVTDRADTYAKFQRLVDARIKDKHPSAGGDTDDKQNQADAVGVYATAAAGYRPQAYADFWDRMFFVDGKVGGPLSDFFGTTRPESKRLRAILKLVAALPPGCCATQVTTGTDFDRWHTLVIANQAASVQLDIKPIAEVTLTPPLRMDLDRLRFSRDGKYILAQDESSIFVLSRQPYTSLFRFNAEKALPAEFSPDSQHIVFHTPGLHTEEWSIADRKIVASHEPLARDECIQSKFTPDGRTIFCVSIREEDSGLYVLDLSMLNAADGAVLFKKKSFFVPNGNFLYKLALNELSTTPLDLMPGSLSADGNVLLIGPYTQKLAFDLRTRSLIPIGKDLKDAIPGAYAFVGNDRVLGIGEVARASGVFSFPDGRRLQSPPFGLADLEPVTEGNYVLTHNIPDYAIGVADVSAAKFVLASKTPSLDVWGGWMTGENADGTVTLRKIGEANLNSQALNLPLSPLGPGVFAIASADKHFLAISTRTRAGVWDLRTGQQVLLSRRFNSAVFAPDGTLYAELPKFDKQDRGLHHFSFTPLIANPVSFKEDDTMRLSSGLLQEWKPSGKKAIELIVHQVSDNTVLWSRTYEGTEPAHTANLVPGQTILSFPFKTDFAKARLKSDATLAAQAAAIKNRDAGRIIQVIDNATGNVLHELTLEVPDHYDGVDGINVVGDTLYLSSSDNRTMSYSLTTRTQLRQLFGYVIAIDAATRRICTVNRRDEAVVYDASGSELATFHMGSPLRFATFQHDGTQLILLTADQKVRTLKINATSN